MLLTQVHKLSWALSQILPIITHMLSNLGSHKKYSSYYYQNWAAKLHYPHTNPNIIWLVGKTQRKPKIPKIPLRRGSFQKSHYDMANSKSYYDVANSMPATMWHYLLSPLLHGISKAGYDPASLKARYNLAPLKARCNTTQFTKPIATRQYFIKSQNHFGHYSTKPK